jgi:hypothetical protein
MSVKPGTSSCRWCRARLMLSRRTRLVRDTAVVAFGAAGALAGAYHAVVTGGPLGPLIVAAGLLVGLIAGLFVEVFAPLVTVSPRDPSPWRRQREAAAPQEEQSRWSA